jgi:hypothetical protein
LVVLLAIAGPAVRIAAGARVKDAILMEGAFVDVSPTSYLILSISSPLGPAENVGIFLG